MIAGELILRRSMAENPLAFDAVRKRWRHEMRQQAFAHSAVTRDERGRFASS